MDQIKPEAKPKTTTFFIYKRESVICLFNFAGYVSQEINNLFCSSIVYALCLTT